jgi:hypothetical protein
MPSLMACRLNATAALLLFPCLAWVSFDGALNFAIWHLIAGQLWDSETAFSYATRQLRK